MMERKFVMSAFVDIRGFGTWIYRAAISDEIKKPFVEGYLAIFQRYVVMNPDVHCKYLGDGLLAVREMTPTERHDGEVYRYIKGLQSVTKNVKTLIKNCSHPPDGIRVRITDGYANKVMMIDPNDPSRRKLIPEFIEYGINTAERLMEVNPEITCLVTQNVAKSLGSYRSVFRSRALGKPSCYPRSVNKEDIETLQILTF